MTDTDRRTHLRAVPPPPDYPEHRGRRVTWSPWRRIRIMCLPAHECDGCGQVGEPWSAVGRVHPRPGERFEATRVRPSRTQPGRQWQQRATVPAWPLADLAAFCCPGCARVDIYDHRDGYRRVDPHQPTLF